MCIGNTTRGRCVDKRVCEIRETAKSSRPIAAHDAYRKYQPRLRNSTFHKTQALRIRVYSYMYEYVTAYASNSSSNLPTFTTVFLASCFILNQFQFADVNRDKLKNTIECMYRIIILVCIAATIYLLNAIA